MSANKEKLKVIVRDSRTIFFDGEATWVTSINEKGLFDILPEHANFISMIKDFVIIDRDLETQKKFTVDKGVLSVTKDEVGVFLT